MGRLTDVLNRAGFPTPAKKPAIEGLIITGEIVANSAYASALRHEMCVTKEMMQQRTRAVYPNNLELADTIADFLHECYLIGYEEGSRQ